MDGVAPVTMARRLGDPVQWAACRRWPGCCTGMDTRPRRKSGPRRALRLGLAEPEIVQIAPAQYRLDLLASMIVDFLDVDRSERPRLPGLAAIDVAPPARSLTPHSRRQLCGDLGRGGRP